MKSAAAGPRHGGQHGHRREAQHLPPGPLRGHEATRVGVQHGVEHLVAGQAGLHQQPPAAGAAAGQPGGPGQQRQGLLGGPVAGRQQLLVEVEEGHHVGRGTWCSTASVPT